MPVSAAKDQDWGEMCVSTSGMMGIGLLCLSCSVVKPVSNSLQHHGLQHAGPVPHISGSLLKLMSIELVMSSNHLTLCYPPSPPALNLSQHQGLLQ